MLHLFPGFQSYKVAHHFWQLQLFHSLLSTILVLAVFIMLLNHRRLKARNKDHKELFGYLQWLVEHDWTRKSTSLEDGLKTILDGLVKTLDERKKKKSPKKGQNIIPRGRSRSEGPRTEKFRLAGLCAMDELYSRSSLPLRCGESTGFRA